MSDPADIPKYIHANCKVCGTRVTPKAKNAGRRLKCPDCETPIQLPTMERYLEIRRQQKLSEVRQPEPVEPYEMREKVERAEATVSVFRQLAEVRQEEAPPLPQYTFFSNVFEFPSKTSDALVRWGLLTGGFWLAGMLFSLNYWLGEEHGVAGAMAGLFFAIALIAAAVWSLAYASSCSLAIIHNTSAGLDRVEGWPDGGVRDWMGDATTIVYLFFVSGFVGLIPGKLLEPVLGMLSPQVFLIQGLVFPIVLLGAYDAETILVPWSPVVVRSVKVIPRDWLVYYGLSLVLAAVGFGFLAACVTVSMWLFGFMLGPVLASQIFIGSRLLGRLAWRIGETALIDEEDDDDD